MRTRGSMPLSRIAGRGELDGVEIEDGTLYIAHIRPAAPEPARALAARTITKFNRSCSAEARAFM
jgi:hypothetical protein